MTFSGRETAGLMVLIRSAAKVLLFGAAIACGAGCHSVRPAQRSPAPAELGGSSPPEQITPVQAANRQLAALADGDPAAIRAWEYCDVTNALPALDASDGVLSSTARLRAAFDKTYGPGQLVNLCPTIAAPGVHLPEGTSAKIEDN